MKGKYSRYFTVALLLTYGLTARETNSQSLLSDVIKEAVKNSSRADRKNLRKFVEKGNKENLVNNNIVQEVKKSPESWSLSDQEIGIRIAQYMKNK